MTTRAPQRGPCNSIYATLHCATEQRGNVCKFAKLSYIKRVEIAVPSLKMKSEYFIYTIQKHVIVKSLDGSVFL